MPDDLAFDRVAEAARLWGLEVRCCAETGSTNADAAAWAPGLSSAGGLVVAGHQTAGRGRLGRTWFSTPGACLLFSLVLRPSIEPALLGLVPLAAGVAACTAAGREGVGARLKWPNDLMVSGRKAGGILCETASVAEGAGTVGWVVVGVGINVNLPADELPPDLRATATSLSAEAGQPIDRGGLLASFLETFLPLLGGLETSGGAAILDAYRPLCETLGMAVRAVVSGETVTGTAVDVDASGGLVLDTGAILLSGEGVHLMPSEPGPP